MSWLSYSDDEVSKFHPVFHAVADDALVDLAFPVSYEWQHHPASAGVGVVRISFCAKRFPDVGSW